jgi:hypothetical protein
MLTYTDNVSSSTIPRGFETGAEMSFNSRQLGANFQQNVKVRTVKDTVPSRNLPERAKAYAALENLRTFIGLRVTDIQAVETQTTVNELDLVCRKVQVNFVDENFGQWAWMCREDACFASSVPVHYAFNWKWQKTFRPSNNLVLPPPQRYLLRLEALRKLPPPTLSEVDTQMKASAEARRKSISKQLV